MTIERAALAFIDVEYNDPMCSEVAPTDIEDGIRAALEAIAEPTPEMINAGADAMYVSGILLDFHRIAERAWRAMHAAMLEEKEAKE